MISHFKMADCVAIEVPPVWVYTWHRYHAASTPLMSDGDEVMYWEQSYAAGATGLVRAESFFHFLLPLDDLAHLGPLAGDVGQ